MSVLLFIAVLVGLIVVHEFGHFIVAKRFGIRVDEFGIFFGPTLFRKRIGETDYTLNTLPLGGFVKIFGEDPEALEREASDRERALIGKPKHVQAAVLVAGVLFNVLAAWVLFSLAFMLGVSAGVTEESSLPVQDARLTIAAVLPDSPAEEGLLLPGDVITDITAGEESLSVLTPEEAATFIATHDGETISISIERSGEVRDVGLVPQRGLIEGDPNRSALGVSMGLIGTLTLPVHAAIIEGFSRTIEMLGLITVGIVSFLAHAFTLQADFSQIAGPVGIVSLVGSAAELGLVSLLTFTAIISLHLAVINLLPIPALDGGRLPL